MWGKKKTSIHEVIGKRTSSTTQHQKERTANTNVDVNYTLFTRASRAQMPRTAKGKEGGTIRKR